MYLFDLASRHMTWLAERQAVTAANIANADTPGYRAQGVSSFSSYVDGSTVELATTSPLHLTPPAGERSALSRESGGSWGSGHSGNNVSIESELMTASSSSRMMSMDAGITRIFHRMILSAVKV